MYCLPLQFTLLTPIFQLTETWAIAWGPSRMGKYSLPASFGRSPPKKTSLLFNSLVYGHPSKSPQLPEHLEGIVKKHLHWLPHRKRDSVFPLGLSSTFSRNLSSSSNSFQNSTNTSNLSEISPSSRVSASPSSPPPSSSQFHGHDNSHPSHPRSHPHSTSQSKSHSHSSSPCPSRKTKNVFTSIPHSIQASKARGNFFKNRVILNDSNNRNRKTLGSETETETETGIDIEAEREYKQNQYQNQYRYQYENQRTERGGFIKDIDEIENENEKERGNLFDAGDHHHSHTMASTTSATSVKQNDASINPLELGTIDEAINYYASQASTCLSLRNLIDLGQGETYHMPKVYHTSLIKSMNLLSHYDKGENTFITPYTSFLFDELPIRFATGITHLDSIPWITEEIEEFATLKKWYTKSFQEVYYLQNVKEIQLAEEIFGNTLIRIQDRHRNELHMIAKGTYKLRGILKNVTNLHQTEAYLDNYYYHYQLQQEQEKEKLQDLSAWRHQDTPKATATTSATTTTTTTTEKKNTANPHTLPVTQKSKNTIYVNKTYIYFNHEEEDSDSDLVDSNIDIGNNTNENTADATKSSWHKWRDWSQRTAWNNRVHSIEDEKENLYGIHLLPKTKAKAKNNANGSSPINANANAHANANGTNPTATTIRTTTETSEEDTLYLASRIKECDDIHYFLDRFHLKRLSLRVLIGHYLELRHQKFEKEMEKEIENKEEKTLSLGNNVNIKKLHKQPSKGSSATSASAQASLNQLQQPVGIVVPQMKVIDIIQKAIKDVETLCQEMYGQHPEIHLRMYSKAQDDNNLNKGNTKQCIYENRHHNIHQSMSKLGHSSFFSLFQNLFNPDNQNALTTKHGKQKLHFYTDEAKFSTAAASTATISALNVNVKSNNNSDDNNSSPITCCYVPDHLYYVVCELLKNAMRATMDRHHREYRTIVNTANQANNMDICGSVCFTGYDNSNNIIGHLMAPIQIEVEEVNSLINGHQISIKISDEGGGIPSEELDHIWCYLYSTAPTSTQDIEFIHSYKDEEEKKRNAKGGYDYDEEKPDHQGGGNWSQLDEEETEAIKRGEILINRAMRTNQPKAQLAGLGYGLPIARLYSNYFGGKLELVSRPGQGLDAYITINKNGEAMEPLL